MYQGGLGEGGGECVCQEGGSGEVCVPGGGGGCGVTMVLEGAPLSWPLKALPLVATFFPGWGIKKQETDSKHVLMCFLTSLFSSCWLSRICAKECRIRCVCYVLYIKHVASSVKCMMCTSDV